MKQAQTLIAILLSTLCLLAQATNADQPVPSDDKIEVDGHDIDSKDYRKLWAAQDAFEADKASYAPHGILHFRLISQRPNITLEGTSLNIIDHDRDEINIPIAADGTFDLPRIQTLYDDNATITLNRRPGQILWMTEVRSTGTPANARRLGDLRLECQAGLAANWITVSGEVNALVRGIAHTRGGACHGIGLYPGFAAPPGAHHVTLINGDKHEELLKTFLGAPRANMHGPAWYATYVWTLPPEVRQAYLPNGFYVPPLRERSTWPDDTLVQFDQVDTAATPANIATSQTSAQ